MKVVKFIKDVWNELHKVVWPSRQQTIKMTIYVVLISAFVALILGVSDYLLNQVIERFVFG